MIERQVRRTGAAADGSAEDVSSIVAAKVHRLRVRKGYSLERLARLSGVSRSMLRQIELGGSTPTIGLLWKIAAALEIPFTTLLAPDRAANAIVFKRERALVIGAPDGKFTSRALFPVDAKRHVEFYELRIAPFHEQRSESHALGTTESLLIASGSLDVFDGSGWHALQEGDALMFEASAPHIYRNSADAETVCYLVMAYVEPVG
jgi:transcriptional regulator with XRE-family HTH domain